MVRAWYMDDETTDQRLEHQRNPPKFLQLDELFKKTGVEYFEVRYFAEQSTTTTTAKQLHCYYLKLKMFQSFTVECRYL